MDVNVTGVAGEMNRVPSAAMNRACRCLRPSRAPWRQNAG